jgi:hypothetical protein
MNTFAIAAILAAGLALPDEPVTPVGFWPGGGSAWSGTTGYYGFGREVPYGYGFGAEANAPRLGMMYPPRAGSPPRGLYNRTADPAPRRQLLGNGPLLRRRR